MYILPVRNDGDQPVSLTYDGVDLQVFAPEGYALHVEDPPKPLVTTCDSATANVVHCPLYPAAYSGFRDQPPPPTRITSVPVAAATPRTGTPVERVTYRAGWNLVGGPAGEVLSGVSGSLYQWALLPGGWQYLALPSSTVLQTGFGYWAYFTTPSTQRFPQSDLVAVSFPLDASQWVMVGNPLDVPATIQGVDVALIYNPQTAKYEPAEALSPGQGAWVYAATGGMVTLSAAADP